MNDTSISIVRDYEQFVSASEIVPPQHCTEAVLNRVRSDLNPSVGMTFLKMAVIHVIVGTLTLTLCPQFGIGGVFPDFSLMTLLNRFGEPACIFGCGIVFLGSSAFVMSLFLTGSEMKVVSRAGGFQFALLIFLSLGCFALMSGEMSMLLAAPWALGAMVSAVIFSRLGWKLRTFFRRKLAYGS